MRGEEYREALSKQKPILDITIEEKLRLQNQLNSLLMLKFFRLNNLVLIK